MSKACRSYYKACASILEEELGCSTGGSDHQKTRLPDGRLLIVAPSTSVSRRGMLNHVSQLRRRLLECQIPGDKVQRVIERIKKEA